MSHLPTEKTETLPDPGAGGKYSFAIGAMRVKNVKIGPFKSGQKPEFSMRKTRIDPPKSFSFIIDPLEDDKGSYLLFMLQNFSNKEVTVTLRRKA